MLLSNHSKSLVQIAALWALGMQAICPADVRSEKERNAATPSLPRARSRQAVDHASNRAKGCRQSIAFKRLIRKFAPVSLATARRLVDLDQ